MPAAQASAGRQVDWFGEDANVPSAHGEHWRSATALAGVLTKEPGAQVVQLRQLAALAPVLKLSNAQAEQVRSAVGEPSWVTYCPGAQPVQLTHGVAGLLSWSQVPSSQACLGASAPAQ